MDFDPQTVVSYTITGGIDYGEPELLLHALVYARQDGPAFPAARKGGLDPDDSLDGDAGEPWCELKQCVIRRGVRGRVSYW